MNMATHKSTVKGVYYKTSKVGSYTYLTVYHHSGCVIKDFNGGPTKGIREMIKHLDQLLSLGDWSLGIDDVSTKSNEYLANMLFVDYSLFHGSYVINHHFTKQKDEFIKDMKERIKNLSAP
jgi:hypothetical protein